ncbi:MAG: helix-turn-helix transcriptional regulator [Desulfobacteraceae bacterium]|nr:helix-turn-helix transcriptional regulator [Desulfobacteraceae bacterium]
MPKKKAGAFTPVGKKIKTARLEQNLTYENIANDTGFSIEFLKNVENGKETPPVGTLLQIAKALRIDSSFLLKEQELKMKDRVKEYTKRTSNYAYATLTPGAENKHLKAFRVSIEAMQEHEGVGYHHEGEEFVYVLSGTIEVMVGDHVNKLKKSESLHFNSGIRHKMKNIGKTSAELLVVIYNQ